MMKKKLLSLLLAAALMLSVVSVTSVRASAAGLTASDKCIAVLKQMEGFLSTPVWDYSQYSVGYGSRCPDDKLDEYKKNGISEKDAEALLRTYVAGIEYDLHKLETENGISLTQNQLDALVLFSYNCGSGWVYQSGAFKNAVIAGKTGSEFVNAIVAWCSAGNQILTGLINRRLAEANLYLNGVYSTTPPSNYGYVIFNGNGGTVTGTVLAFEKSGTVTKLATASRTNYTFAGWFTATVGGQQVTEIDGSMSGRTLFAHWTDSAGNVVVPEAPKETAVSYDVKVTADPTLNIRSAAGTGNTATGYLSNGAQVSVVAEMTVDGLLWGKLSTGGWIALKYTEKVSAEPETTQPETTEPETTEPETTEPETTETQPETKPETASYQVRVTGSVVNTRAGAGTDQALVSTVNSGDLLTIIAEQDVDGVLWGQMDNGDWLCLTYTEKVEPEQPTQPEQPEEPAASTVTVTGSIVNVRSGAGTDNGVVGSVRMGDSLSITETTDVDGVAWGHISGSGWICLTYTDYTGSGTVNPGPAAGTTATVTGDLVNVRSGAGTGNSVRTTVTRGTSITILSTADADGLTWGELSTGGWICLQYTDYSAGGSGDTSGTTGGDTGDTTGGATTGGSVTGTVTASQLRIRSAAGLSGEVVGSLNSGASVEISEQVSADGMTWGHISSGWISMSYVSVDGSAGGSSSGSYTVTGDIVNVRSGAGTENGVVKTVTRGTALTIVGTTSAGGSTWGELSTGGWICMDYVA